MKVITYKVLEDCVEKGVNYGFMRAHKHSDNPSEDYIKEQLAYYVMLEISEYFTFDDDDEITQINENEE